MTGSRRGRKPCSILLACLAVWGASAVAGRAAWAQAWPGWTFVPSISVSGEYDSNINGTASDQQSDLIGRLTPGVGLSYVGPQASLSASYFLDAAIYAEQSELNNVGDNQRANVTGIYTVNPLTTVGLMFTFTLTGYSADFLLAPPAPPASTPQSPAPARSVQAAPPVVTSPTIGVDVGRQKSWAVTASPYATRQFTPSTSGSIGYSFTRTDVSGGASGTEHEVSLSANHAFRAVDQGSLRYTLRVFPEETEDSEISHTLLLGWARQFTRETSFRIEAGPHVQQSSVSLEANADLAHAFQRGSVGLSYRREQTLVVGEGGAPIVDTATAYVSYVLLRDLNGGLSVSFSNIAENTGPDTRVYGITAGLSYPLSRWAAGSLSYQFSLEDTGTDHIDRHVVTLAVTFAYPVRLR